MSLSGLRKQINKANQMLSEKIGGAKGTELDPEFQDYERKIDILSKLIEEMINCTHEYMQPNPATRARLMTMNTLHKFSGKGKSSMYPQPEGVLGECMAKYGKELGEESPFAESLSDTGETFRQMAEIKYQLEDNIKQNFIEPFQNLQIRELREISHHRKKLEGRRLDFDCKKRKQDKGAKIQEDEIKQAEDKFEESKSLAELAMTNFLSSEVEHIQALQAFIHAQIEYHDEAKRLLEDLSTQLITKREKANLKPKPQPMPKRSGSSRSLYDEASNPSSSIANNASALFKSNTGQFPTSNGALKEPSARALYDFDAENDTEVPFKEGDIIKLIQQVDENWYEGEVNGHQGYFPVNYVEVIVPLS